MAASKPKIEWDDDMVASLHSWASQVPPMPLSEQAERLGVSKTSLARKRKSLGLTGDRSHTAIATEARTVDAAAKRATLVEDLTDHVVSTMAYRVAGKHRAIMRGEMGVEEVRQLDFIPVGDERTIAQTMQTDVGTIERLRRLDTDPGIADAESMLGGLLGLISQTATDPDADD